MDEFEKRWPFLYVERVNHRWSLHECGERFSDMLGLPLESPPPSPENPQFSCPTPKNKRRNDDEDDDDDDSNIETKPSAAKRRRISREFRALSHEDQEKLMDELSRGREED